MLSFWNLFNDKFFENEEIEFHKFKWTVFTLSVWINDRTVTSYWILTRRTLVISISLTSVQLQI